MWVGVPLKINSFFPFSNSNLFIHPQFRAPISPPNPQILSSFSKMAEFKDKVQSVKEWMVEHKLRTVGCLWLSSISGLIAYNWSRPMKTSVKIIHARVYAQGITLAALAGAALVEYHDQNSGAKADKYAKYYLPNDTHSQKD